MKTVTVVKPKIEYIAFLFRKALVNFLFVSDTQIEGFIVDGV